MGTEPTESLGHLPYSDSRLGELARQALIFSPLVSTILAVGRRRLDEDAVLGLLVPFKPELALGPVRGQVVCVVATVGKVAGGMKLRGGRPVGRGRRLSFVRARSG